MPQSTPARIRLKQDVIDVGGNSYKKDAEVEAELYSTGLAYVKGSHNLLLCSYEYEFVISDEELLSLLESDQEKDG